MQTKKDKLVDMKKLFLMALLFVVPIMAHSETEEDRKEHPHEVRLLIGDMLFETLMWHNDTHGNYMGAGNTQSRFYEKQDFGWTPHFGLEYQYRINRWLGVGMQVDYQHTLWNNLTYNNQNQIVEKEAQNFYNISLMPTVRFTYLHHPYVNLYSAISLGIDINGGSEKDIHGRNVACGAALDIAVLGLSAGDKNWFGSIEVGGLSALKNKNAMYMLCSRILTVGVGYRF